jgi:cytochrome c
MLVAAALGLAPAHAQLRGHGGPIRALAISADGMTVLSGSFDTSAIRWSLRYNLAEQVLRLHESAVNAVAILNDGRAVTGGADALIGIWTPGKPVPDAILRGHEGPIVALAVSPDGGTLASASWDRTVRLWPLAGGPPIVLKGHQQNGGGHQRRGRLDRSQDAERSAHPGRTGHAGLVSRVPPRRPHIAHRRRRPRDPPLGCRNR